MTHIHSLIRTNSFPVVMFSTVFVYGLIYRARLYLHIAGEAQLVFTGADTFQLMFFLIRELFFATIIFLLFFCTYIVFEIKWFDRFRKKLKIIALVLIHSFLLIVAFLYGVHYLLTISVRSGLTLDMLVEVISANSFLAMSGDTSSGDALFFVFIFVLFWLNLLLPKWLAIVRNIFLLWLVSGVLIMALIQLDNKNELIADEIRENPLLYTINDISINLISKNKQMVTVRLPERQMNSVALIDEEFVENPPPGRSTPISGRRNWNLLFLVLESVGAQYVFNTELGNHVPMPFLKQLKEKSLYLANHFSPANTSPRASFSLFSGLYPAPRLRMFVTGRDVRIPGLIAYLPKNYSSFLIHNGGLDWFFPLGFYKNNGVRLYGLKEIIVDKAKPGPDNGRNESEAVNFLIDRLENSPDPFLAFYHSYIAHWPYFDYGKEYDIFPHGEGRANKWIFRYYNNLRLMDRLLNRIFDYLKSSGRIKNTIVIITGDHGQAFGQHNKNWIHSRGSFNENYQVPALIYQPRLFKPREVKAYTSHIDILPTLLDAMGIVYNPRLIQGESLFQKKFRRKYNFLYGNEQTISSISRKNIKLQISLIKNKCWVYDLNKDPGERNRLKCNNYGEQKNALLSYLKYQNQILDRYNRALKSGNIFYGEKHFWEPR